MCWAEASPSSASWRVSARHSDPGSGGAGGAGRGRAAASRRPRATRPDTVLESASMGIAVLRCDLKSGFITHVGLRISSPLAWRRRRLSRNSERDTLTIG